MWKIIEDLKSLEIKATHHKEILDEVYEELEELDAMALGWPEGRIKIREIMDKLEDM